MGFVVGESHMVSVGGGYGLFSIEERLIEVGGSLTVTSEPGEGTIAVIEIPLQLSEE